MLPIIAGTLLLSGCVSGDNDDLVQYMEGVKQKPTKPIEPIPTVPTYKAFNYGAAGLRSPFDRPSTVQVDTVNSERKIEAPDTTRPKEVLEGFSVGQLGMVGTIEKDGQLYALVDDSQGGIHKVVVGNYVGRNYGKVMAVSRVQIDLVEIVPDGQGGWSERPKTIALREVETR